LIAILNRTLEAIVAVQDPKAGVWWQVIDRPHQDGNYLEATSSCMFAYALLKGVNEGYLDESVYLPVARKTYQGILDTFIQVDEDDGEVHLLRCCAVAGLGGNPYRDGSYEYYVGEPIRANDPKGMGPFITASLEMEKLEKRMRR
jgi:unsaturated rhamnogalacturonyl hydrolase